MRKGDDVRLDDRVVKTVEHGINTKRKYVLMIVRIDLWCDGDSKGVDRFIWSLDVNIQNASKASFELDRAVLVEVIIEYVLYIFVKVSFYQERGGVI